MKKMFVCLMLGICALCTGQVQRGYVRTAGDSTKESEPLQGVIIYLRDSSSFVSGKDGGFTLSLPFIKEEGEGFEILAIRKKGYELLDTDCLLYNFVYSTTVPLEIVMISSKLLQRKKADIEQKARSKAEKRYREQRALLEHQLKNSSISCQEYKEQIALLDAQMKSFDSLIAVMADRYARTDYDNLDSLNAAINTCIANGELEKADSLINTKGCIIQRAKDNIEEGHQLQRAKIQFDDIRTSRTSQKEENQ